jgi:hypothetical protein
VKPGRPLADRPLADQPLVGRPQADQPLVGQLPADRLLADRPGVAQATAGLAGSWKFMMPAQP